MMSRNQINILCIWTQITYMDGQCPNRCRLVTSDGIMEKKWPGLIASLICVMLCGIVLSFSVYAVPLKTTFSFSQTQVELVGSLTIAGSSLAFIGGIWYHKFGCRVVYIAAVCLVNSTCICMWLYVKYAGVFKDWIVLMCVSQFLNTTGIVMARCCCMAIGVLHFPKRHGLLIGLYLSLSGFGKIYYAAIYQLFFKTDNLGLGKFFLLLGGMFSVVLFLCYGLHIPPVEVCTEPLASRSGKSVGCNQDETSKLPLNSSCDKCVGNSNDEPSRLPFNSSCEKGVTSSHDGPVKNSCQRSWTPFEIYKTSFFHLIIWPNCLVCSCVVTIMTNVTILSTSVSIHPRELPLYILAAGIVSSRIAFGILFDHFRTIRNGLILLNVSYLAVIIAFIVGLIRLNSTTLYIVVVGTSIGIGQVMSLTLIILTSAYGSPNLFFIATIMEILSSISTTIVQLVAGLIYDKASEQLSLKDTVACKECFYWVFVLLLIIPSVCGLLQITTLVLVHKKYLP